MNIICYNNLKFMHKNFLWDVKAPEGEYKNK